MDSTIFSFAVSEGTVRTVRSRFIGNGHPVEHAQGTGGVYVGSGLDQGDSAKNSNKARYEFVDSEWLGNSGRTGGAITGNGFEGTVEIAIERCLFRDNIAREQGGAICIVGQSATLLLVDRSTLEGNTVQSQQSSERDIDISVIVYTGALGGDAVVGNGAHYPIWRIDVSIRLL